MAQKVNLQMGASQGGFEGADPLGRISLGRGRLPLIQPGVLPSRLILGAPVADQSLAEIVFPTELGQPLLTSGELADDLQLELAVEVPFHHQSAPLRCCRERVPRRDPVTRSTVIVRQGCPSLL